MNEGIAKVQFCCKDCRFLEPRLEMFRRCKLKPKLRMTGADGLCDQFEMKDYTEEKILNKNW